MNTMDRMELKKVSMEADDDSTDSLDCRYTEPMDSEKATINRSVQHTAKSPSAQRPHPGHASFGMSVFNLSNAIMGSGILGLSYAMANTGIVLFSILLFGVAALSLYSVHLLLVTAKEGGRASSLIYEKLGERAFGWPGKMAAFGSITLQNIGAMSSYLFIVKYELPEVIRAFLGLEQSSGEWYLDGNYLVVFVSMGVILPLSLLKNLGYLGYTSGFSLSCMVFFLGVVSSNFHILYITVHITKHVYCVNNLLCSVRHKRTTAYTVPILAFAFVCHPEVLPIYSELKDRSRKKMQRVSNLSILAMLIMYMLSALFGYLTFYENVEAELLHTFTKVYKFDTLLLMVRLAVLTAVTLTVPIVLFPIRSSIITLLCNGQEFSWLRHIFIAAAILVFNNLLVIFVPTIRDIFGFIGSSAATMLIFILPAGFYLKLVKSVPMKSPQKISAAIFLVVGFIFMIVSLSLIVMDWIHNPSASSGGH
uniref:Amino acid transporter transmembrane domain-containing protein n=1 Tax=Denticeps clupeoides TaxID=299321 RepID=A0AAY4DD13_9TELE